MFSSQVIPTRSDFIRRRTDETEESTFSSDLPTPVDDEVLQPFDQLVMEDPDSNVELRSSKQLGSKDRAYFSKDNGSAPTKPRSLSKAVMKAKQFAQYLAKSNRSSKKRESISDFALAAPVEVIEDTLGPTPELAMTTIITQSEDRCGAEETNMIFIQPNQPIEQLDFTADPIADVDQLASFDTALEDYSNGEILESPHAPNLPFLAHASYPPLESAAWNLSLNDAQTICTKVLLFLPWCVLVGGTIVLFPSHLEPIAFGSWPGFHVPSPKGIYRFALWADCAMQHVMIFLALLSVIVWYNFSLGLFVAAAVLAQFMHAWGDFRLDRSVSLGDDDRQTIYLCIRGGLEEGIVVKQPEGGYLVVQDGATE